MKKSPGVMDALVERHPHSSRVTMQISGILFATTDCATGHA
jgi:hypothetical protein